MLKLSYLFVSDIGLAKLKNAKFDVVSAVDVSNPSRYDEAAELLEDTLRGVKPQVPLLGKFATDFSALSRLLTVYGLVFLNKCDLVDPDFNTFHKHVQLDKLDRPV
jgi:hypothetical protein